jgi:heme/copper-type cytochrome/quinol oxidase subunit 2
MVLVEDLNHRDIRLLEVDEPLYLPVNTPIRLLFTSSDVIHSWSVPCLRIKIDCIPRRLNQVFTIIEHTGIYYRQCSELCRALHSFIPIKVDVDAFEFIYCIWLTYDPDIFTGKYVNFS